MPIELFSALFFVLDFAHGNNRKTGLAIGDTATYLMEIEAIVNIYGGTARIIELAKSGESPIILPNINPDRVAELQNRLREAVGATNT